MTINIGSNGPMIIKKLFNESFKITPQKWFEKN